jgi:hypothetical protein
VSAVANALRGEASLLIAGQTYILRPSFEHLVAAESELGALFALVERAASGGLTLTEITALLWHCLPADTRPGRELVGAAVLEMGLIKATQPVRSLLAQILEGAA